MRCALPRRFPPTIRPRACWPWPDGAPPTPCATSRRIAEWSARLRDHADKGLEAARLMTEAEFAIEDRRFDDARVALQDFAAREGRHIAALRLSLRAEQGAGNWREVARLVRQLEKHQALTAGAGGADS
jgi:uncharacterized protein HemY